MYLPLTHPHNFSFAAFFKKPDTKKVVDRSLRINLKDFLFNAGLHIICLSMNYLSLQFFN